MRFQSKIPDAARLVLAQFGRQIEYSRSESNGRADLTRSDVTNDDLRHFVFTPGFDTLILDQTQISDAGLRFIGHMRGLGTLRLNDTLISDDGLNDLLDLPYLERLEIGCYPGCLPLHLRPVPAERVRRNQITDRGLGYLTDLRCLLHLSLEATRITDCGLSKHIPEMPQLQGLSVAYNDMRDEGLKALECLSSLESINLTHTAVSSRAIVEFMCGKLHTLRRLNLSNTVIDDVSLAEFMDRSRLEELTLIDTGVSDAGCREIARCDHLTDLRLDYTNVSDDGVRFLRDSRRLRKIELFKTKVTDTSLVWLSDSKIEHLGLGCTSITDAFMPALVEIPTLQSLDLQGTAITDKGVRLLSSASRLIRVYLEYTRITNAGIGSLLKLPLKTLSLNLKMDDEGLRTLSQHKTLRNLAIWNSKVTDWQPLASFDRLKILLIDDAVIDLSPLQTLRHLKVLILWGTRFSPTEVARLRLSLPNCQIKTFEPHERAVCNFRILCDVE